MRSGERLKIMNVLASVDLRGKHWILVDDPEYCLSRFSKETKSVEYLRYPGDLSESEIAAVDAAWKLEIDELEKGNEKTKMATERSRARAREDRRKVAEGAAWIRDFAWHVERDHIWRIGDIVSPEHKWVVAKVQLNFNELTNDELTSVMQAKEREVLNRGIGGFIRRLSRKLE